MAGYWPRSLFAFLWTETKSCFFFFSALMPYNKSFIDQASSVKMAGYWPRSLCAFLWTETNLLYGIRALKKETKKHDLRTETLQDIGRFSRPLCLLHLIEK